MAESSKRKHGTAAVEVRFLSKLEKWWLRLAHNLALRNPGREQQELHFAVQQVITWIVFLRIAEDHGVAEYGRLRTLLSGGMVYSRLAAQFRCAGNGFHSGLFESTPQTGGNESFDAGIVSFQVDDDLLKDVICGLYDPDSSTEVSLLTAGILGLVHEHFLGMVVRLTAGDKAEFAENPDVRKSAGVFYTPTAIVDYIVKQTVGDLLEKRTPQEAAQFKVLDPACGGGAFLLGAYQFLLDWHRDWYVARGPQQYPAEIRATQTGWRLTTAKRTEILLNNIFGVDIDLQAVEITKLSLLLKLFEEEECETTEQKTPLVEQRTLPDLSANLKCGNALISTDFYDSPESKRFTADERLQINAFDWETDFEAILKAGGFDAVIGNPPYDVLEKKRGAASRPHAALAEYVNRIPSYRHALGGKMNLFRFFVVRSLELTRSSGRFGMIVPLAIVADTSCGNIRRYLLQKMDDLEADCFPRKDDPHRRVFFKAKLSTVVFTGSPVTNKNIENSKLKTRVYPGGSFAETPLGNTVRFSDTRVLDPVNTPIPLTDARSWALCLKIHRRKEITRLADIRDFEVTRGEINQTTYREFICPDKPGLKRLLKGAEIGPFRENALLKQGMREWFDETQFQAAGFKRANIACRRIAGQRITGVDEKLRLVATLIAPGVYFADSTNSIAAAKDATYRLEYLLGLLNSRLFQWRFKLTSTNNNVSTNELLGMPFRTIDFSNKSDKTRYDRLVRLVVELLALNAGWVKCKPGHDAPLHERQIVSLGRQLDGLVYELYSLEDSEIAIIETTR